MKNFKEDFDLVHDIAPGKHFYQFYKSPEDLIRILIPYWQAGIQKKNFCFWVVPSYMNIEEGKEALRADIPNIDELVLRGSFEILNHQDWYGDGKTFDGNKMAERFIAKLKEVVARGFSVLRASGDTTGFEPHLWNDLQAYERFGHTQVRTLPFIGLCSYPIHTLRLQQTKDVLDHHDSVLIAKM